MASALSIQGVSKAFGSFIACNNINLEIPRGTIFGLVGPNGAGKTTLLNMVTGLLEPDHGTIILNGYNVWQQKLEAKRSQGVLADGLPVFNKLSGAEFLSFSGALHSMTAEEVSGRSEELLNALGLSEAQNKRISEYSAGMTKKILLAQALLHNPPVLILDEPLEAVDPVSGQTIQGILRKFTSSGGTVVLSSHVMSLVEGLCSHVGIIHKGHVALSGHVDEIRSGRSLTDVFVDIVGTHQLAETDLAWLGGSQ